MTGKTIVHLPNWLGDMVMAIPFMKSLRDSLDSEICCLGKSKALELLEGLNLFDQFITFNNKSLSTFVSAVSRIRAGHFTRGVILPHSFRSALLFFIAGVPSRVGYERNGRGFMLTDRVEEQRRIEPTVEHYLKALDFVGGTRTATIPELTVTRHERENFLKTAGEINRPYAAFIVGAQYGPSKRWPENYFAQLADLISERFHYEIYLLPGKGEENIVENIINHAAHPESIKVLDLDVGGLKACLSGASIVITSDTGPRHIAAALRIPTIVFLGPMDDSYTYYPTPFVHVISKDIACRPCNRKECKYGHECMRSITPPEVLRKMEEILEGNGKYRET